MDPRTLLALRGTMHPKVPHATFTFGPCLRTFPLASCEIQPSLLALPQTFASFSHCHLSPPAVSSRPAEINSVSAGQGPAVYLQLCYII